MSKDKIYRYIAWKLPRKLVMWCYMRVAAHATTGRWSQTIVPDLSMMDAIQRWDESNSPYENVVPWSKMTSYDGAEVTDLAKSGSDTTTDQSNPPSSPPQNNKERV